MKKYIIFVFFLFLCFGAVFCEEKIDKDTKELTDQEQMERLYAFKAGPLKDIDLKLSDQKLLKQIAEDTWGYFRDLVDKESGLPIDNVIILSTYSKVMSYTTTTNIGLYLMCVVAAEDFGFCSHDFAVYRIEKALKTLQKLKTWEGQYYNYYETITLNNSGKYISVVDNGWLAAGLIVAKEAFKDEVGVECEKILKSFNFKKLYDKKKNLFYLGYDEDKNAYSEYHYGTFCTEPRLASYIAIAKGAVPEKHWFSMFRTMPKEWDWQGQIPKGEERKYFGNKIFQGYYAYKPKNTKLKEFKFVPSWGGSLFEFLMPTMVLNEQKLAKKGLGLNNIRAVEIQIDSAISGSKYKVWGMSPCSIPGEPFGYSEYGIPELGIKGYENKGVVTPHVTFLALPIKTKEAIGNIRELLKHKGIYGQYGFYDAVDIKSKKISDKYLFLDQAMSFISLSNYLKKGNIIGYFHKDKDIKNMEKLLKVEKFF